MTIPVPEFMKSEYFTDSPNWRMKKGAPDNLIREFEEYFNSKTAKRSWKAMHPDMQNPFYTWEGKFVDQK